MLQDFEHYHSSQHTTSMDGGCPTWKGESEHAQKEMIWDVEGGWMTKGRWVGCLTCSEMPLNFVFSLTESAVFVQFSVKFKAKFCRCTGFDRKGKRSGMLPCPWDVDDKQIAMNDCDFVKYSDGLRAFRCSIPRGEEYQKLPFQLPSYFFLRRPAFLSYGLHYHSWFGCPTVL